MLKRTLKDSYFRFKIYNSQIFRLVKVGHTTVTFSWKTVERIVWYDHEISDYDDLPSVYFTLKTRDIFVKNGRKNCLIRSRNLRLRWSTICLFYLKKNPREGRSSDLTGLMNLRYLQSEEGKRLTKKPTYCHKSWVRFVYQLWLLIEPSTCLPSVASDYPLPRKRGTWWLSEESYK